MTAPAKKVRETPKVPCLVEKRIVESQRRKPLEKPKQKPITKAKEKRPKIPTLRFRQRRKLLKEIEPYLKNLSLLSDKERQYLELYLGLNGKRMHTREDIAKLLETTKNSLATLSDRAIKKLKDPDGYIRRKAQSQFCKNLKLIKTHWQNFSQLHPVLQEILRYRYGLGGNPILKSGRIAQITKVPAKLVRGFQKEALKQLCNPKNEGKKFKKWLESSAKVKEKGKFKDLLRRRLEKDGQKLKPRWKEILELRFGLGGEGRNCTLEEIATKYGVSWQRIDQLINQGLKKLGLKKVKVQNNPRLKQ